MSSLRKRPVSLKNVDSLDPPVVPTARPLSGPQLDISLLIDDQAEESSREESSEPRRQGRKRVRESDSDDSFITTSSDDDVSQSTPSSKARKSSNCALRGKVAASLMEMLMLKHSDVASCEVAPLTLFATPHAFIRPFVSPSEALQTGLQVFVAFIRHDGASCVLRGYVSPVVPLNTMMPVGIITAVAFARRQVRYCAISFGGRSVEDIPIAWVTVAVPLEAV
jgi:hypothetical protein